MRLALISVLGLVAAACGDDSVTVSGTQDNFCDQIADVACHNLYQCCTESEIESRLGVTDPRTELQCREDYKLRCERGAADAHSAIKAGTLTFDAAKFNSCLEAILAPADVCSSIEATPQDVPWVTGCKDTPFVGTVAVGGACVFQTTSSSTWSECAGFPDTYCAPSLKCTARPTAGFPCSSTIACASAYYCQSSTNTCAPKLAAGAPCQSSAQCDKDLFCDTKATVDPADDVCAPKGAGGASCQQATSSTFLTQQAANSACISGNCNPGTCSGTAQQCYSNAGCGGHCSLSLASCTQTAGYPCNPNNGMCTGNGMSCMTDANCSSVGQGTCFFTQTCVPSECVGDVVCTSTTVAADYCTAVTAAPNP